MFYLQKKKRKETGVVKTFNTDYQLIVIKITIFFKIKRYSEIIICLQTE